MCRTIFEKVKGRGGKVNKTCVYQKQPFEGLLEKGVMRAFAQFTKKHLCRNLLFDKVKTLHICNFIKTSL